MFVDKVIVKKVLVAGKGEKERISGIPTVQGRVTSRLNSLCSFESGYCVFEGYLFDFLAAFYVEIDIGVVIANIHFVDQVVNEAASEF